MQDLTIRFTWDLEPPCTQSCCLKMLRTPEVQGGYTVDEMWEKLTSDLEPPRTQPCCLSTSSSSSARRRLTCAVACSAAAGSLKEQAAFSLHVKAFSTVQMA